MRNREGKYNLIFEEWVMDPPFIISPRISFKVSVRLLGGLMALGYTIASILKRSSHVFADDRVCVKIDWLEQVDRHYVQVLGRDRVSVRCVAEQLGLEGSYIPRTYLEQMKIEKLLNEVMVLPDDLKTKLSLDEEMLSSPKGSISLGTMRNKLLKSGMSHSYSTERDTNLTSINSQRFIFDRRNDTTPTLATQGAISQLSEQISTLNDRMDEFTSRIVELNSQFTRSISNGSQSQQKTDPCNGNGSTSYFTSGLANSSSSGSTTRNSSLSTQLAKDSNLIEEISGIARSQLKIMHQLDILNNGLRDKMGARSHQEREVKKSQRSKLDGVVVSLLLALACGGVGIFLFKDIGSSVRVKNTRPRINNNHNFGPIRNGPAQNPNIKKFLNCGPHGHSSVSNLALYAFFHRHRRRSSVRHFPRWIVRPNRRAQGGKMHTEIPPGEDYISDLPQSIIETILVKLPLIDAVRTSILSNKWRYKWATLTQLEFDDKCVSCTDDRALAEVNLVNFVTRFLFLHDGPIHRFSLSTAYLQSSPDVDQWLLFLSRKDVKELVLELGEGEWFRAPSCLFACRKLVRLELVRCELDPPSLFKGFLNLKYLNLQQVLIAPEAVENLISCCPLLESLTLSYFDSLELTIRAPNLKYLILEGEFKDIYLENTPMLVAISVAMYITDDIVEHFGQSSSCNFDKFLGGVPSLERLIGHIYFTKYMSIGNTLAKTQITYQQLKVIELYQVSFEDMKEIMVVLRLILSAPNLRELQISGSSNSSTVTEAPDLDFWEKDCPSDCTFKRLKVVKMMDMSGVPHEMGFIQFLLGNSPVLEIMSISPSVYVTEGRVNMLIDLLRLKRASAEAEIIFVQDQV
ncbi:hypothetical protein SSX86_020698 [Deinandra increscens subsp. villosa]|uniref:CYTH domain-containing protein n=1 Tax=Deinandra increscens subsp. villosa TaxID=3103831 RepID=A0AAP0CVE6_9ASTR